jgi:hypothetical protein
MRKLSVLYSLAILLSLAVALILVSHPAQAYVYDASLLSDRGPDTGYFTFTLGSYPLVFLDQNGGHIDKLRSTNPISGRMIQC